MSSTILLLAPSGARPDAADLALRAALDRSGVRWRAIQAGAAAADGDALVLAGGLGVADLLGPEGEPKGPVADLIRAFHSRGRWIGAPCMALAVALEALSEAVTEGRANRREVDGDLAVFPDLRLLSTSRPLLGRTGPELDTVMAAFISSLASAAAHEPGSGARDPAHQAERQF